ncbi:YigZ family protein [Blautia sp. RD014234]|nr:YigZ family protein [Blautia parvula]
MLEQYNTIYEGGEGEIIEKKSRFIATVRLVKTEEEALSFIEEMRKNTGMPPTTAMPMS